jgi:MFS family permease
VEVGTQREENYLGIKNVLKHPNIILGGFLSLATLNIMNAAYSNVLEYIKLELSLNYTQSGALMSAYFVGYAIGQIPWGFMADKFGSRRIMSISVLGVSLSTLLFGFSSNFKIAVITRFLSGLLGAGVFVPSVRLVSGWFKADERGTALGILNL